MFSTNILNFENKCVDIKKNREIIYKILIYILKIKSIKFIYNSFMLYIYSIIQIIIIFLDITIFC